MTKIYYPHKNLADSFSPRKVVEPGYDIAGRLSGLKMDGIDYASNIQYNAASQTESLKVGPVNANQVKETYNYDPNNGLLTQQQATRNNGATTLLDLSYSYANAGNHLTGALVNLTDNRDTSGNHNRSYVYDALGRLTQAKGGPANPLWTQNYSYDRYGNRTSVTATGNAAGTPPPACSPTQTKDVGQFVQDFYQRTLQRQPTSAELNSWTNQLRQSYYAGATALNQTVAYLGRTLFKSQEYANLGRTDAQFVSDLYWSFLQRAPDGNANDTNTGWGWWTNQVAANGRDAVRDAFANDGGETAARNAEICPRVTNGNGNTPIPLDGLANLSYDKFTNRITTAGFGYDAAGNQRRIVKASGTAQKFQYDAANRLVTVYDDYGYTLQSVTYGSSNQRLIVQDGDANSNYRTYYAGDMAEYVETPNSPTVPQWNKTSIYLGARLLATLTPNGSGEYVQYQHPDRLGTRLITNGTDATTQEQVALPYGTALDAESTGASNKRFTSYNRSGMTGLDYAVNRHYDSQQGRFTQVDPLKTEAMSLEDPQSMNLYAYCGNDPINRVDPDGLFWGKLLRILGKVIKWVAVAAAVAVLVLSILVAPGSQGILATIFEYLVGALAKIGSVFNFASGGLLAAEGASTAVLAGVGLEGLLAVGAVEQFFGDKDKISKRERKRRQGQRSGRPEGRRIPRRIKTIKLPPLPTPPTNTKPETRVPRQPEPPPNKPGGQNARLPENANWKTRLKYGSYYVLDAARRVLGLGASVFQILTADPEALAEIACKENPSGRACQELLQLVAPQRRCIIAPRACT